METSKLQEPQCTACCGLAGRWISWDPALGCAPVPCWVPPSLPCHTFHTSVESDILLGSAFLSLRFLWGYYPVLPSTGSPVGSPRVRGERSQVSPWETCTNRLALTGTDHRPRALRTSRVCSYDQLLPARRSKPTNPITPPSWIPTSAPDSPCFRNI